MKIAFRQGIVQFQNTPTFLFLNLSGNIDLDVSVEPTIITFADGRSDYLYTEKQTISDAWLGPFDPSETYWLYWDIDKETGVRSFNSTTVDPLINVGFGPILPSFPIMDQHFFDTSVNKMKVWNGDRWDEVIRVFAGTVDNGINVTPLSIGSQIADDTETRAGHIIFDSTGDPIKKRSTREFVTTETILNTQQSPINAYKIESIKIPFKAVEDISEFHCISWKGAQQIGQASHLNPDHPCFGVAIEVINKNEVKKFATNGYITYSEWNFTDPPNTPVWVGKAGEVTTTRPNIVSIQQIGVVVDPQTIYLDINDLFLIDKV